MLRDEDVVARFACVISIYRRKASWSWRIPVPSFFRLSIVISSFYQSSHSHIEHGYEGPAAVDT